MQYVEHCTCCTLQSNGHPDSRTGRQTDGPTVGRTVGGAVRQMDRRTDRQSDGLSDGRTVVTVQLAWTDGRSD